ncbi:MAG TPA: hypothetical protein VK527_11395 [Candidatus Limnocylindrales bacterium]|jgi:hypothetical protein|nr:hypothetical protein [Candidatus Limnocylindrales bacterium]
MKRNLLLSLFALASLVFAAPIHQAQAAVSVGVSFNTGSPYRGLSLSFRSQPDLIMIPTSRVYYARNIDQDLYRYGDNWYYTADDCWYAARSYRGPFVQISVASVPYDVYHVPASYRRHWGAASRVQGYGNRNRRGNQSHDQSWGRNRESGGGNTRYRDHVSADQGKGTWGSDSRR